MNCRPNDQARIVGSLKASENGVVVRVVERHAKWSQLLGEPVWLVELPGARLVASPAGHADTLVDGTACIKDSLLRPIGGAPVEAEEGAEVLA